MDYDAIVVGAGPGGSAAALELARAGARVGLFEQQQLPRYKPCGGCLSLKIDRILEPDFHAVVDKTVHRVSLLFEGVDALRAASDRPLAYMVMRGKFDLFLAHKARAAGAQLRTGKRVLGVIEERDRVRVRTGRGEYSARYVVGADGASSIVARSLKLAPRRRVAVCVEAEVATRAPAPGAPSDEVRIDFGAVPFGYGWVFPKRDHLSVGVGGLREKIGNPRAFYDEFLIDQDLADAFGGEQRHGYIIPLYGGSGAPLASRRALLAGDAAALVDPLLGEGIYYAVRSGQLAGQTIARALADDAPGTLAQYARLIEAEIHAEFRPARKLAWLLYAFPRAGYAFLKRRRECLERFFDLLRGEAGYGDLWREFRRAAPGELLRSLRSASRRAPRSVAEHYDRLARRYDASLFLWRTLVSGPAWQALGELIARSVRPGATVLDAGTGTGDATALVLARANPGRVLAVDASKAMLHAARKKIPDARVVWAQHDITSLPYPDASVDVVVSTWTLETLPDPRRAVREFLRVIKDDGFVIYAFSARPAAGLERLYARLIEQSSAATLHGRFLQPAEQPYHDCGRSRLMKFANGLAAVVVLRKCCSVDDPHSPCLPTQLRNETKKHSGRIRVATAIP